MAIFKKIQRQKPVKPITVEESLEKIGNIYIGNLMNFQHEDFKQAEAMKRYEKREQQIAELRKNEAYCKDNPLFDRMVQMQKDSDPRKTYQQMKMISVETAANAVAELYRINNASGERYTIGDCICIAFEKNPKEKLIANFLEGMKASGEENFPTDLLSPKAFDEFGKIVDAAVPKVFDGERLFKKGQIVDVKEWAPKEVQKRQKDYDIER